MCVCQSFWVFVESLLLKRTEEIQSHVVNQMHLVVMFFFGYTEGNVHFWKEKKIFMSVTTVEHYFVFCFSFFFEKL